jgi:hypothetical protein
MKGIREAAMSKEPEPYAYDNYGSTYDGVTYKPKNSSLFDYDNYPVKKSVETVKGVIEIMFTVEQEALGPVGDDSSLSFDWNKAQNKAEEIAYDRLIELCGKEIESKYSLEFNTYDDGFTYEVTCILTPNK